MDYEPIFDRLTDTDIERYSDGEYPKSHSWDPMMERCTTCRITREELDRLPRSEQGCHG